jgi:hypothetical protein
MLPRVATYPTALDLTSLLGWAPVLPHAPQLWTSLPYRKGLRRYHVSHSSGPHLLIEEVSSATTCPMALDLASLPRRAPTLPCVLRLWTP